ncbi:inorganic polyphosphate kinase [Corynebacterium ulcerans]|uniref:NAD kinase n=1 Tax=Corynebacterium ramonii TaxID=3026968 RepID=A0ABN4EFS0_9CORY|nr:MULTISPECIES: NAD kinase [Corynebacterium]AIU32621.1 NAD kinase [Corynebacterium ramonii FRC0011]AKA96588.1 NAD kinase [Corynebacterium ulcerans]ESU58154.1 inorganic polyphosphate/ATP-NAD kinase [Corynebacterium ulcerans NCTC 12077]KPJ24291.1 inorganic polyphosphate kinase [Corynebacterium ulcerans]STC75608.1 Inorganic polyphosphate/ATP-NAD kinase [Corynebacterium ulcerans]
MNLLHSPEKRLILLVPHTGRDSNVATAALAAELLDDAGIAVRILVPESDTTVSSHPVLSQFERVTHSLDATNGVELILVLGGDGTFLRAADLAHAADLPVLGINLGHVGFLAEWEKDSLDEAVHRVMKGDYRVEERMTLDVEVRDQEGNLLERGWALNEVSIENTNRRGVLDATLEVDERPVSSFGCDGVIVSTPTGSTAYAFSAGGPVLWPELDAIVVVPNNAHALFTKPLVVSPQSLVAVESKPHSFPAMAVMDGFRSIAMPPGARTEARKGQRSVKWVRLDNLPFADRLVSKLRLPVEGWRGPSSARLSEKNCSDS